LSVTCVPKFGVTLPPFPRKCPIIMLC
jgi:hypothetical protein